MKTLFCHGLESGPHGSKYRALVDAGYDVLAPDCRGKNLEERVELVSHLIAEHRPLIVGSSYGGITAVLAVMRVGGTLPGMVLCAPALRREEAPNLPLHELRADAPTVVVHGVNDDVIPVDVSRIFAHQTGARLIEVDDGHRLDNSLSIILEAVASFNRS